MDLEQGKATANTLIELMRCQAGESIEGGAAENIETLKTLSAKYFLHLATIPLEQQDALNEMRKRTAILAGKVILNVIDGKTKGDE